MNISQNFKKAPWTRRVHPDQVNGGFASNYKPYSMVTAPGCAYVQLTAQDFLNELSPAAHPINSRYMSTRPIWKKTGESKDGKEKWEIDGYDELESVALGWQLFISGNKIAHLTGDGGFDLANESKDGADLYESFLSLIDEAGLHDAFREAAYYAERGGDSGILLYQSGDEVLWEVYATEKGHTIYPREDENGHVIYYIDYWNNNRRFCDIITTKTVETWVAGDPDTDDDAPFFEELWERLVVAPTREKSDDGYTLIRRKAAQAGSDLVQFTYFRVPDTSWGPMELSIEAHENAASYVANEVKDSAFPILVLKAEKVNSLPPSKMNGKTIAIKGTSDSLAHSDVKYESPADASNIATVHFRELNDNIIRGTQTAIITPEIMKQGADSSTAIKILFRPEIEWAQQRWIYYYKPIKHMIKVAKRLFGKAEGEIGKYDALRTSVWQKIWLPQNEKEQMEIVTQKVYARVLSRKNALNELGSQYKGDYELINKEWEQELAMKQKYSAKQEDTNPDAPKINNQDPGKTIAQQ